MAKDSDPLADAFGTKQTGGLFSAIVADERSFDRRMMLRLGAWGVAAVGAVVVAVMANQAQLGWRRDQLASADLARQADRLQSLTRESQNEARRLAAAIETLNTDRDRLYARVTVLEQGLDSVTGAIARQSASAQATAPKPQDGPTATGPIAPSVAPVASTPAAANDKSRNEPAKEAAKEPSPPQPTSAAASLVQQAPPQTAATLPVLPLVPQKSIMAPPDPAASKLIQAAEPPEKTADKKAEPAPATTDVAAAKPAQTVEPEQPAIAVQQTRFAVELGGANSIDGLRALWRGLLKSNPELAALRPIIMIKEGTTGLGMQLRLGAGPLLNAAAAAKFCAGLSENERHCETTVFDGQRLSLRSGPDKVQDRVQDRGQEQKPDKNETVPQAEAAPPPQGAKPDKRRRSYSSKRSSKREEPAPAPVAQPAPKPEASAASTLTSFFRR